MNKPYPGSPEAVAIGCKCPVIDNHHGKGWEDSEGHQIFRVNWACPIHGISRAREAGKT